jgi:protein-tyrosine phosphatase
MTDTLSRLNFRDVGGLATSDGGRVRSGLFFRSEGPKNFDEAHLEELSGFGFRAIFDLRSEGERDDDPHDWQHAECVWLHLDMNNDLRAADKTEWDRLREDPDMTLSVKVMSQNYGAMPTALLPHWKRMAEVLLGGATPAMINCTAGKDRTGVAVALLLDLVGVARDEIMADYRKSDIFGQNMAIQGSIEKGFMDSFGFVPNQNSIDALIGVQEAYLDAAFAEVAAGWGGIEDYFDAAGVDSAMRGDLRTLFVVR